MTEFLGIPVEIIKAAGLLKEILIRQASLELSPNSEAIRYATTLFGSNPFDQLPWINPFGSCKYQLAHRMQSFNQYTGANTFPMRFDFQGFGQQTLLDQYTLNKMLKRPFLGLIHPRYLRAYVDSYLTGDGITIDELNYEKFFSAFDRYIIERGILKPTEHLGGVLRISYDVNTGRFPASYFVAGSLNQEQNPVGITFFRPSDEITTGFDFRDYAPSLVHLTGNALSAVVIS
jgi:hypothetical protein